MRKKISKYKTFFQFALVGASGTVIDFIVYQLLIIFGHLSPAFARFFSYECGTINNFILNNSWTFRQRKTNNSLKKRFISFQGISSGGLAIGVLITSILDHLFGNGYITVHSIHLSYNVLYFLITTPPILLWNFLLNHFVTWKHHTD